MTSSEDSKTTSLSVSEEDLEDLYEHAPCGYLSTLPNGTFIKANKTFLEWTGYSTETLINNKRFQDLLTVAGRIFYDTHFGPLLLMQNFVKELAFELVCADRQRMPVLLNASLKRDRENQPHIIRITLLEARSRRSYEEELRHAKRQAESAEGELRQLTEQLEARVAERTQERDRIWRISRDLMAAATTDGTFLSVNPAFTTTLGWDEQELTATSLKELTHPDHLNTINAALADLEEGQVVDRFDIPNRHKDGSYRWMSWMMVAEGQVLYAVGRDVTGEREQAKTLQKTRDALRQAQKMEAIGKLTGGVAHDFNNILQVVAGNLELLKLAPANQQRADSLVREAFAAVDRGAKLASQLLSFARRQPLKPMPTDLGRIVRDLDGLLRRTLGEPIELETVVCGGLWTALVDRNQLENVIINMAINARDAMEGEGRLTIELGNARLDQEYADVHSEVTAGQYVQLSVSDTGPGIPREIADRIFEPFFTTKGEGRGTGLGLSMAYGFVKQSGGHISVYSEPGVGTTFKIYLPRVHQEEECTPAKIRSPIDGGRETILVVEDDKTVQATVIEMLQSLGYNILHADEGASAVEVLEQVDSVDLLFTDVVMPGPVKSPILAKRAKDLHPDIAVLFTSGYTENAIVHGGRLDPDVELISKPYRRDDLARRIRQLLDNKKREDRVQAIDAPYAEEDGEKPLHILAVDDDVELQQGLRALITSLGHSVRAVVTAEEAARELEKDSFDVLLTDVSLPGMTGTDLARKVAARFPDTKIVFASGYGPVDTEFPSFSLPKPYTLSQLQEVLAAAVSPR